MQGYTHGRLKCVDVFSEGIIYLKRQGHRVLGLIQAVWPYGVSQAGEVSVKRPPDSGFPFNLRRR